MNVQSLTFLVFLTGTVCLCRMAGRWGRQWQITLLLAASLIFYLWGGTSDALWGCGLLACSAMVTLLAANALQKKRSRSVLAAAACWHLAVLMLFKYTGFLSGGAVRVPFVPMGISFFTFQQLWYLHEVYTGAFAEVPPAAEYLTYSLFFPTVSSGPILKPQSFFPQIEAPISPTGHDTAAGLYAVSRGLAKKVLLADNLGILVNNGWENLSGLTAMTAWFVILGYSLQLYFDFSGYCDIAAGCARLLGLRLPVNFEFALPQPLGHGVLEALAHDADRVFAGMCLFPAGRQPPGSRADVSEHSGGVSHQRHLAWGRVDIYRLGTAPRRGAGHRAPVGRQAGRAAEMAPLGHDVFLPEPCVGVFPGTGYIGGGSAAENRCNRGLWRDSPMDCERPVPAGIQRTGAAGTGCAALYDVSAGGADLGRGTADRPVAPEHRPADGGVPPDSEKLPDHGAAGGMVDFVLYRCGDVYLFQFLRKEAASVSDRAYKRWSCGLLLTLLLVLGACAAVVYWVDPCFYYRMPKDRAPVFFSERYQTAGIVRNNAADVVLLGSSMTANYRGSKVGAGIWRNGPAADNSGRLLQRV